MSILKFLVSFNLVICACSSFAATKYWSGATSADANKLANWFDDAAFSVPSTMLPVTGDDIILGAGAKDMKWNLNDVAPGSWTQTVDYTGTVTFHTGRKKGYNGTLYGFTEDNGESRVFKITGNCSLQSGTWTHPTQPDFSSYTSTQAYTSGHGLYHIIANILGDLNVGAAFIANANDRGFSGKSRGPGAGLANSSASHGGYGGGGNDIKTSAPYGSFRNPCTIGSSSTTANVAGGAIELSVGGALTIADGAIFRANAKNTTYYTGSGGSISIIASSISGGGTFMANGGEISNKRYGGGGGGGRISIILTGANADFSSFTGTYSACHMPGTDGTKTDGSGGTIYLECASDGEGGGTLIVDGVSGNYYNRPANRGAVLSASDNLYSPKKIILRDNGVLISQHDTKILKNAVIEASASRLSSATAGRIRVEGKEAEIKENLSLEGSYSIQFTKGSTIVMQNNSVLTVGASSKLFIEGATELQGSLHIGNAGAVMHSRGITSEAYKLDLTVTGDVTIDAGGKVDATGMGYQKCKGPGAAGGNVNVPGLHAGRTRDMTATVHCYGSLTRPINYGSGGGYNNVADGGGAIILTVEGKLINNGSVSANGANINDYYPGSGGSVWVTASEIAGTGSFTADAGTAGKDGNYGMGSGGRVSLWITSPGKDFSNCTGQISAFGGYRSAGTKSANYGGGGTIYLKTGDQAFNEGTLIITNKYNSAYTTELVKTPTGGVTDLDVGSVHICGNGRLEITNATLTVRGSWINEGNFIANQDAVVEFVDATKVSTIKGKNAFKNFYCTEPGKKLVFGTSDKDKLSITDNGSIKLIGNEEGNVILRGDDETKMWHIGVSASANTDINFVDVANSDAESGSLVVANNSDISKNQGNLNWQFVSIVIDETNEWTGLVSELWTEPGNWTLNRIPVETDVVVVPNRAISPTLSVNTMLNSFVVEEGATLSLNGNNLTVTNSISVAGKIIAQGTETLTFSGDVSIEPNGFDCAFSRLFIEGSNNQQIDFGNCELWHLSISKSGGEIQFANNINANGRLVLEASGATVMNFAPGSNIKCFSLDIVGNNNLTLQGQTWNLDVAGVSRVRAVKIGGCTAVNGRILARAGSVDLGSNDNIVFSDDEVVWIGGSTGNFETPANWSGGVVPRQEDDVILDGAVTVTINEPITIKSLEIGGLGNSSKLVVKNSLTVAGDITINNSGTIVADKSIEVGGSVFVCSGGLITHNANADTELYKVEIESDGVFYLEEGANINVSEKGYAVAKGPGAGGYDGGNNGASHGGIGCGHINKKTTPPHAPCYGSLLKPINLGSGGKTGGGPGGGAVRIFAGGEMRIDGVINAEAKHGSSYYPGSGGSIYLKCALLSGEGKISVNGGNVSIDCPGGGGRIAVYETEATDWSAWHGQMTAYGGIVSTSGVSALPGASAGTIYLQTAADVPGGGIVKIDNRGGWNFGADLPVLANPIDGKRAYTATRFQLGNGGSIRLRGDVRVKDIALDHSKSYLYVLANQLSILSTEHINRKGWLGNVTLSEGGEIIWIKGFVLSIR